MPHYRLYRLSPENRIKSATDIDATCDEAAVAVAGAAMTDGWELWSGRRLVDRAAAVTKKAAPMAGRP